MPSLIAGIDEAGRGPVIGPLVVAGLLLRDTAVRKLRPLGVKDSKLLTAKKRESMLPGILDLAEKHSLVYLSPAEVDDHVLNGAKLRKLNWLEAKAMARIIRSLHPDKVYLDSSDTNAKRFGLEVRDLVPYPVRIL